jgi:broad specificity phosphatase PhoE
LGFGAQCDELATHLENELPLAQKIELIVVSPMRRTLQTAQQGLGWLIKRGVPVVLRPEWQENSDNPCDTGTDISTIAKEWPQFDWSTVDPQFPAKTGVYEFSRQGLQERGIAARKWLRSRPEKVIAVVSHSGFLRVGVSYKKYENGDFRIFDFAEGDDDIGGKLIEWELTEVKLGGLGKSPRGYFPLGPGDYPPEPKIGIEPRRNIGEAVNEEPN